MEKGLDAVITSGLSSAAYGTDFWTNLRAGMANALVDLAGADIQNEIGVNFAPGSAGGWASHMLLGCVKSELTGADCAVANGLRRASDCTGFWRRG